MNASGTENNRILPLNDRPVRNGAYVLYWMQQSQRAEYNHALEYAIELANHHRLPVLVVFGLTDDYPEANRRHYVFMLEGLLETHRTLSERGISMVVQSGHPPDVAVEAGADATVIICDRGYLRHQREWRKKVARYAKCRVVQVESDVVVPVEAVSQKAEYAARTIRPKIHKLMNEFIRELRPLKVAVSGHHTAFDKISHRRGIDLKRPEKILKGLGVDNSVPSVERLFRGGTKEAKSRFSDFIANRLANYDRNSNQPQTDDVSCMSPYLHFGQISPVYLALEIKKVNSTKAGQAIERYLEELIVRRELAVNFVTYTENYDSFGCIPGWAKATLIAHLHDERKYIYNRDRLEAADTHDPYWNAAMKEMLHTGFMHNYMRMYWAKKILEWSVSPDEAYSTTLYLNNKYFLDGRDPNSYEGVAWTYGVHDRAWPERPIFGKARYMAASGLERKCDIRGYVAKVDARIRDMKRVNMSKE
jgi:deoxyribodipyrimidine photo-lyase